MLFQFVSTKLNHQPFSIRMTFVIENISPIFSIQFLGCGRTVVSETDFWYEPTFVREISGKVRRVTRNALNASRVTLLCFFEIICTQVVLLEFQLVKSTVRQFFAPISSSSYGRRAKIFSSACYVTDAF